MLQPKIDEPVKFDKSLFANRDRERELFFDAINNKMYLDFYAVNGQGKTHLLHCLIDDAAGNYDYICVYIDLSPTKFHGGEFIRLLRMVSEQICHKKVFDKDPFSFFNEKTGGKLPDTLNEDAETDLTEEFNIAFYDVLKSHKVLLCLDDMEEGNLLAQKFEKEVLRCYIDMPNLMLVTAGQKPVRWETFRLIDRVEPHPLECLDKDVTYHSILGLSSRPIQVETKSVSRAISGSGKFLKKHGTWAIQKCESFTETHTISMEERVINWTLDKTNNINGIYRISAAWEP